MRLTPVRPEFVTFVPAVLAPGVLYISMEYATALHSCCCGCGNKVVTPLAPDAWSLTFDGKAISLSPSIGNWSFPCQSHYWIRRNAVMWDRRFSRADVAVVRGGGAGTAREALGPFNVGRPWWRRLLGRSRR